MSGSDRTATPVREALQELRARLGGRQGLVSAVIHEVNDVPPDGSAKLLEAYRELIHSVWATLRGMHGDSLPHGHEGRCGYSELDIIPPCRMTRDHSPAGSRFISSFHVWREEDVWIIATGCFAEHPGSSHYVVVVGLARDGFEGMRARSA